MLLTAFLKAHHIPARARCGFGTYFTPNRFEDHWMTEYWHADERRWVQVDSQIDDLQRQVLGIVFDSLDMPRGKFVLAGETWQMCRAGQANSENFGIFQWHGWDFIKGNVLRDLLAALTLQGNEAFTELRRIYEENPIFHIPADWIGDRHAK